MNIETLKRAQLLASQAAELIADIDVYPETGFDPLSPVEEDSDLNEAWDMLDSAAGILANIVDRESGTKEFR